MVVIIYGPMEWFNIIATCFTFTINRAFTNACLQDIGALYTGCFLPSTLLESHMLPIYLNFLQCTWYNIHVVLHTDNTFIVATINKGSCSLPLTMQWLQFLFWLSVNNHFTLTAFYIPNTPNSLANAFFRAQFDIVMQLLPQY